MGRWCLCEYQRVIANSMKKNMALYESPYLLVLITQKAPMVCKDSRRYTDSVHSGKVHSSLFRAQADALVTLTERDRSTEETKQLYILITGNSTHNK